MQILFFPLNAGYIDKQAYKNCTLNAQFRVKIQKKI